MTGQDLVTIALISVVCGATVLLLVALTIDTARKARAAERQAKIKEQQP